MVKLGIWVDDPVSNVTKTPFWRELKAHGITTAAIMLEGVGKGFDPKYSINDLVRIGQLADAEGISIVLTCWPQPDRVYLKEFEEEISKYIIAAQAVALECDLESNWLGRQVSGFVNLDKAGDELVAILKRIKAKHSRTGPEPLDFRIEVTTFTEHAENGPRADVASEVDCLLPQAYSVRNRTSGEIDWDGPYGPGNMQKRTLDRALQVPGIQILSCGLAAYDQIWPGKKGEEAMQVAFDKALTYNPREIRFWSSKWVIGIRKNGYSSRFIKSLKGCAV